jgi:diguanylate cyclase (GGDEF)-like protein/PAS domain S-box-containing protein
MTADGERCLNRGQVPEVSAAHPRTLGWYGTTALAMGGSNQSLFIMAAMFAGQGEISGQGSAAVPLLIAGLLLAWAAAPGWTELILMFPNRVGGISASCAEAFRPYSPVLANLTGVCYWWGWIPTCGLTAILSASAVHHWYAPGIPVNVMAVGLVLLFTGVNLCGVKWVGRMAVPVATTSAAMAFLSGMAPIFAGEVDWRQALHYELTVPFPGWFGELTSLMAGLYLVGFAAPAFEAAACHVGETVDPNKNVPRAMFASGLLATLYFVVLPVVWLGVLGPEPLGQDLALVLGPTFAPIFGNAGKAAAIWFMVFSMFSGTMQPLAGASRTLMQLSEDGLLPRFLALRSRTDAPWAATLLTAGMAILFLLIGDPIWLIAAANFTYLIGISLPSVAVWLLRKDSPAALRPYRAPDLAIQLGLLAAMVWAISALLGFEQFGLPTVVIGVVFAYAGSALYAWRTISDRRRAGLPGLQFALQFKLTGAMLMVLVLDGAGYLLAVSNIPPQQSALMTGLADIFVAVAMLSITVALVLPGMVAHAAKELSEAARHLAAGTMAEFSRAMSALGRGDLDAAHARFDVAPVRIHSRDEVGEMAASFNLLQGEIGNAAVGLGYAREGLRQARGQLTEANTSLELRVTELHEAEEKLSSILESIDNIVWSASVDGRELLYVNAAIERTHGRPMSDFIAEPRLWFDSVHPDDRLRIDQELAELQRGGGAATLQYRVTRPDGELRWLEDRVRLVRRDGGQPLRLDGVAADITQRRLYEERLDFLANHDALTGLPNRNLLNDRLSQALALAHRTGRQVALLFLDLDQFKYVNDHYGHTAGDELLRAVTARLGSELRQGDTLARLGGDEFVIMLWDALDKAAAMATAHKLLAALARPMPISGHDLQISASIGVSLYPRDGDSVERLLQYADAAMYRAKHLGRNGVQFYTPEMSEQTAERVLLEAELRGALERGQFVLHYQPQVSLSDGRVIGFEALIRWPHPQLGDISPTRFIPIAEDTGLINAIGEWVLRSACAQLKTWHDAGHDRLTVAVNMSARQINQNDVPALVRSVLQETGLAADRLELELTESALLSSASSVIDKLRAVKAMGVSLAIDDFGTGYSSLGYLKRYPIDIIKIDRSFTVDVNVNAEAASIAGAIIAMAKSLGMKTVTEGLETGEQLRFFRTLGCDAMQGHYFAPALPAQEIGRCPREGFRVELPL